MVDVVEARSQLLTEQQAARAAAEVSAPPPVPARPQDPWLPCSGTVCFGVPAFPRRSAHLENLASRFSAGPLLFWALLAYTTQLTWAPQSLGPADCSWLELAVDFEAATGRTILAPLSARKQADRKVPQLRDGLSALQKATEFHAQVEDAARRGTPPQS